VSADLEFRDVRKRLEEHGWELSRIRSSHHIFTGPERPTLSIPVRRGKVKPVYGKKVDQAIEQFGKGEAGQG
jgi:predicted RNA binding protein YcfA (HicA-like mRNA interferase family)